MRSKVIIFIILFLLFSISHTFSQNKFNFELNRNYDNNNDFFALNSESSLQLNKKRNINLFLDYKNQNGSYRLESRLNTEYIFNNEFENFYFINFLENNVVSANYLQIGKGVAYTHPSLKDKTKFPFKHKFSIAVIYDNKRGSYISNRYKFNMKLHNLDAKIIFFILSYGKTFNAQISYNINKYLYLKYKFYYENIDVSKYYNQGIKFGIKLFGNNN